MKRHNKSFQRSPNKSFSTNVRVTKYLYSNNGIKEDLRNGFSYWEKKYKKSHLYKYYLQSIFFTTQYFTTNIQSIYVNIKTKSRTEQN